MDTSPLPRVNRRPARLVVGLGAVLSMVAGVAACSTAGVAERVDAPAPPPSTLGNDKSSSLTVVVHNNSTNQALTLQGQPRVDNGALVQGGYPTSIAAQSSGEYLATNTGNGVQMWLSFAASNGATVTLDSNIPKVNQNSFDFKITGPGLSFGVPGSSGTGMSGGDHATSTATLSDCASDCNTDEGGS